MYNKIILCLITALLACNLSGLNIGEVKADNSNRQVLNFNTNWKWINRDIAGGELVNLDEKEFSDICLPHSHAITKHLDLDPTSWQIVSWYRRHFSIPESYNGQRIYVEFQGASQITKVYVNGTMVGEHKGAFTGFTYDITDYVNRGEGIDNVIAVQVDARKHAEIPPEFYNGEPDFYMFGGITRDVHMIITNPVHVDWNYVWTEKNGSNVDVKVKVKVDNKNSIEKNTSIKTFVIDANSNIVASSVSQAQMISSNGSYEFLTSQLVENPKLWSVDSPNLYTIKTQVFENDVCVDEKSTVTGLRWTEFNKEDGQFYLNDQHIKLRGLNWHEVYPFIGRSLPDRLSRDDARILKYELGCNWVRLAHYPYNPEFLDECDKVGLVVMEEIPGWQQLGDASWQAIDVQALNDMVIRDRNHPSIIAWGTRVNEAQWEVKEFQQQTHDLAKLLDPTRATILVRYDINTPNFIEDVYGTNSNGNVDEFNYDPTYKPLIVTEFNGNPRSHARPWGTEYESLTDFLRDVRKYASILGNPYIAGGSAWCGVDYWSSAGNGTDTELGLGARTLRWHGAVDMWRYKKWNAYAWKAQDDPAKYGANLWIANYWKTDSSSTIYVTSNCDEVELFRNGVSLGKISPNEFTKLPHPLFRWDNVAYIPGTLKAEGYISGVKVAEYVRTTPAEDSYLVATPRSNEIIADGSDMTMVVVELKDKNGQLSFNGDKQVDISITGPADFVGESSIALEGGRTGFLVRSKLNQTGTVTCNITVHDQQSNITSATANIEVVPMTEPIVPVSEGNSEEILPIYLASDGFLTTSPDTWNEWKYQYAPISDPNNFNNFAIYAGNAAGAPYWGQIGWWISNSQDGPTIWNYGFVGQYKMSTGKQSDVSRTFIVPTTGEVEITSRDQIIAPSASSNSDGVNIKIMKQDAETNEFVKVWPEGSWKYLKKGDLFDFAPINVMVKKGDKLYFVANKYGTEQDDAVSWNPQLTYKSVDSEKNDYTVKNMAIGDPDEQSRVTAQVEITNINIEKKNVVFIIAVYDNDLSALHGCSITTAELVKDVPRQLTSTIDIPSELTHYTVKVYLWNNTGSITPLSNIPLSSSSKTF